MTAINREKSEELLRLLSSYLPERNFILMYSHEGEDAMITPLPPDVVRDMVGSFLEGLEGGFDVEELGKNKKDN